MSARSDVELVDLRLRDAGATEGEEVPPITCCGTTCCILCAFQCVTVCGLRNAVCQKMVFAPPYPPFYEFRSGGKMFRIPLKVYDEDEEYDSKCFVPVESKTLKHATYVVHTRLGTRIAVLFTRHPKARYTILFSHGNAADIGIMSYHLDLMAYVLRCNVYSFDYTGYGESSRYGHPTPAHVLSDIEAAYTHLTETLRVRPDNIILYGQSIGTCPTVHLASQQRVLGVILHSPLMSALRVIYPYFERTPCYDIFPNIDLIKQCESPVFIIHGKMDAIVPVIHGMKLYDAAPIAVEPWFVADGEHNDIESTHERIYFRRVTEAANAFRAIQRRHAKGEAKAMSEPDKSIKFHAIVNQPVPADLQLKESQTESQVSIGGRSVGGRSVGGDMTKTSSAAASNAAASEDRRIGSRSPMDLGNCRIGTPVQAIQKATETRRCKLQENGTGLDTHAVESAR